MFLRKNIKWFVKIFGRINKINYYKAQVIFMTYIIFILLNGIQLSTNNLLQFIQIKLNLIQNRVKYCSYYNIIIVIKRSFFLHYFYLNNNTNNNNNT